MTMTMTMPMTTDADPVGEPPWCGRCGMPAGVVFKIPPSQQHVIHKIGICTHCRKPMKHVGGPFLVPLSILEQLPPELTQLPR